MRPPARIGPIALAVLLMVILVAPARAEVGVQSGPTGGGDPAPLFAVGGTPVSNGIFFPGTAVQDPYGYDIVGVPYQITRGTDIMFHNLDPAAVANAHKIRSFASRNGRPLFESKLIQGPGSALMITSHLKPGIYGFFCPIHFGMMGQLEVVP